MKLLYIMSLDARGNFFKLRTTSTSTPYDYGSIMHYGAKDFSINGRLTIEVKARGVRFIPTLPSLSFE